MRNTALVVIDIQNDITKHYKDVIGNINAAIDWAVDSGIPVVYIRHENLSEGTRTFKPNTRGAEFERHATEDQRQKHDDDRQIVGA